MHFKVTPQQLLGLATEEFNSAVEYLTVLVDTHLRLAFAQVSSGGTLDWPLVIYVVPNMANPVPIPKQAIALIVSRLREDGFNVEMKDAVEMFDIDGHNVQPARILISPH